MIAAIRTLTPTRIRTLATGFAGVHTLNAGLTMIYTLIQTLIFSRVLDHRLYSMAIVATAVGLYLMPMNQAVARANFVVLRERAVKSTHRGAPEAAAAFNMNQIILMLVPFLVPLTLGVANGAEYAAFTCYLFFTTYSNIWYFEIQMSMMAVDQALPFERLSFLRRVVNYATLILLAFTRDFLLCNVLWAAQTIAFHLYVTQRMARGWGLFGWPHGLTGGAVKRHSVRLWVSLQATGAEWLTLNGPYAVFVARFGVGPGVVTVDAVLKLLRIVVSVTRNLSEIALPRVSRALLMGDVKKGHMPVMLALGGGGLAALACGIAVTVWEHQSFSLLLGPNNVVPLGAGGPTALALIAGVGMATGGHIIGYSGDHRSIPILLTTSIIAMGGFALFVLFGHAGVVQALWAAAIAMIIIAATAVALLARILRPKGGPFEPHGPLADPAAAPPASPALSEVLTETPARVSMPRRARPRSAEMSGSGFRLMLVVLAIGLAVFCVAPWFAFRALRAAAQADDYQALGELIDFDAVRAGLRRQADATAAPAPSLWRDPVGAVRHAIAPLDRDPAIEALMSAKALRTMTQGESQPTSGGVLSSFADLVPGAGGRSIRYWDPNRCRISVKELDGSVALFTFERKGAFAWKLVQLRPPQGQASPSV